jgi:hypothetical protein
MEEGVEPPPGYRPNCPSGIQVHPNGITVDSLAALFQAHAGIQAAALTALSQIDSTLISTIERPIHTQVCCKVINLNDSLASMIILWQTAILLLKLSLQLSSLGIFKYQKYSKRKNLLFQQTYVDIGIGQV